MALGGCGETDSEAPLRTDPSVQDARSQDLERRQLDRVPADPPAAVQGEVPGEVTERIRAHLAQRTGAPADSFEVVRGESHQWPDGSMGCPQPNMLYIQSLVQGYWIVLRHDDRDYDYRVDQSGHFVACEGTALEQPPSR
jgi:hypothetical protein